MPMLDITRLSSNLSIQSNQAPERGASKTSLGHTVCPGIFEALAAQGIEGSCLINNRRTDNTT